MKGAIGFGNKHSVDHCIAGDDDDYVD